MKTLSGALIPYGSALPTTISSSDGALFYKTDSVGGPQGLYLYGFIADSNPGAIGNQVAQGWVQATSPDLFVLKAGDTMTGALSVPAFLKVTQATGAQRLLIGNQDSGGTNKPSIIQGTNGVVLIGTGSTWLGNGGTLLAGLSIDPSSATGLTFQGGQVWHAGNDGTTSTLDADLLDGQHGSYYQDVSHMTAGILAVARGGTGNGATVIGGVAFGGSASQMNYTAAGSVNQVLLSAGTGTPVWANQSALSVGYATSANSANSATTAGYATTAGTAANTPWTGITGFPTASQALSTAGFPTTARPSLFYDMGNTGASSMTPPDFPTSSITGFDAYTTSDMGSYQVGMTVMGTPGAGGRAMQLSANWNFEEAIPTGLRWRVNDDTSTVTAWGPFQTLWDQGNLTNLNQLANGPGYITTASLGGYLLKAGDTMSGALTMGGTNNIYLNGITLNGGTSTVSTSTLSANVVSSTTVNATGTISSASGIVNAGTVGVTGRVNLNPGGGGSTGYIEFYDLGGTRQAYIGNASGGNMIYVAENSTTNHAFNGSLTATGNITAYSSDGRLKKNVLPIENAVQKVVSLGGYTYDWDLIKCNELGFKPEREHEHGLIAQEVEKVLPDAVAPAPFNNEYKTVRYDRVVALLTAAIGEQQKQIEALLVKITALEAK